MRKIKFREYDTETRNMYYLDLDSDCLTLDCSNIKTMQYTGLKDKNGVEIYENDIVKIDEDDTIYIAGFDKQKLKYVLSALNKKEYLENVLKYRNESEYIYADDKSVIGNIYENPELLDTE